MLVLVDTKVGLGVGSYKVPDDGGIHPETHDRPTWSMPYVCLIILHAIYEAKETKKKKFSHIVYFQP